MSVAEALGGYQAVVLVAPRPWLDAHPENACAVTDCLLDTIRWASDPANAGAVAALLAEVLSKHADTEEVAEVADALFGASSEFLPDGRMRHEDTDVVVDLFNAARGERLSRAVLRTRRCPVPVTRTCA